jgi:hypothetical protein
VALVFPTDLAAWLFLEAAIQADVGQAEFIA